VSARFGRAVVIAAALAWAAVASGADPIDEDRAYALNRKGMVAMSEARFAEAIEAFDRAADVATDYTIMGRSLMYTPVFMSGWASEKIGRSHQACRAYREYLRMAVEHPVEPTKVDHAKGFISANCRDVVPSEP
jgi:tetratricopeptide (TPR) repeat protein